MLDAKKRLFFNDQWVKTITYSERAEVWQVPFSLGGVQGDTTHITNLFYLFLLNISTENKHVYFPDKASWIVIYGHTINNRKRNKKRIQVSTLYIKPCFRCDDDHASTLLWQLGVGDWHVRSRGRLQALKQIVAKSFPLYYKRNKTGQYLRILPY